MQIRLATPKDKQAWDIYVDSHSQAAPYSCFAWKEAVEQAYGHKSCYLIAEEQGAIKGILPLFIFRIPFFGSSLVSLPFCDVGDVYADSDTTKKSLLLEALNQAKKHKAKNVNIRSCQGNLPGIDSCAWPVSVQTEKIRMLLKLPDSSEKLWKSFKSKLRSQVRKAKKNGLIFRWGKKENIPDFYRVFSQNMHDLGSPVHSRKWIEQVLISFGDYARMGLVFKDDRPVGCGIILFTRHTVSIPWASTLREFNRLSPNMLLYWNFLKFAADNEKKVFDFGRSTVNEGTYRFKKQWGAEPERLYWYGLSRDAIKERESGGGQREKLARIWQKMPLSVANFVGPLVRKYISL